MTRFRFRRKGRRSASKHKFRVFSVAFGPNSYYSELRLTKPTIYATLIGELGANVTHSTDMAFTSRIYGSP